MVTLSSLVVFNEMKNLQEARDILVSVNREHLDSAEISIISENLIDKVDELRYALAGEITQALINTKPVHKSVSVLLCQLASE